MNKICVVSVYFGKLPESFPAWRRSCLANTKIDFLLITDQNSDHRDHNIQTVSMAFSDFAELARQKLAMNIVLTTAYKCCDYKPVYGLILEDYLTGYDYWGYCDMDLVFGDLTFFFEREQLYSYDKFLPLGHLCLYRNTQECNNRYKLECNISNDYKTTFSTAENLLFDEREGIKEIYSTYGFAKYDQRIFADIDKIYKRMSTALRVSTDVDYKHEVFYWENGKTYRAYLAGETVLTEEFIYIHFQKRNLKNHINDYDNINAFYILSTGFKPKEKYGIPDLKEIRTLNPYQGIIYEKYEELQNFSKRVQRKLKRILT